MPLLMFQYFKRSVAEQGVYYELESRVYSATYSQFLAVGFSDNPSAITVGSSNRTIASEAYLWYHDGQVYANGVYVTTTTSYAGLDRLMLARKGSEIWLGKNGTWLGGGNPSTGLNPIITTATSGVPFYAIVNMDATS